MEDKEKIIDITDNDYIISSLIKLENGVMLIDYDLPYQKGDGKK